MTDTNERGQLSNQLRGISILLMARYTPENWSTYVPGATAPKPTVDQLASLAENLDRQYQAWSGGVPLSQQAELEAKDKRIAELEERSWPNFDAPPKYENPTDGWEDPQLPDFQKIWETARALGYAVALHGSMKRDCDLVAVPWVENASPWGELVHDLCMALDARVVGGKELKPNGRIAFILQINGYYKLIDLSIVAVPEFQPNPANPVKSETTPVPEIEGE